MAFTENFKELLHDTREYLRLEWEELQIVSLHRLTRVLARLFLFLLVLVFSGFALLFTNLWLSLILSEILGSFTKGFGAGLGLFILEIVLIISVFQPLLRRLISNAILREIKDQIDDTTKEDQNSQQ